jgi:hypothetical protein
MQDEVRRDASVTHLAPRRRAGSRCAQRESAMAPFAIETVAHGEMRRLNADPASVTTTRLRRKEMKRFEEHNNSNNNGSSSSSSKHSGVRGQTAGFPISLEDWQREERRADAIRLGLLKSYGEVHGQPVYKPTADLVRLKSYLARRTPEIAEQKWLAYRSAATPGEARSLLAGWLSDDPGAVVPGPPPPSERAKRRPTQEERALGREVLDELVDAGLFEVVDIRADGEPIYSKSRKISASELKAGFEELRRSAQ